jgi:isopentenyl-diphosphate delta-isomerase type 2
VLLANLGLTQAAQQSTDSVRRLVDSIAADALCLHLNPAQELIQVDGDRDFSGGRAALQRLARELPVPVIVKETGCGVSRAVGLALRDAAVRFVDVAGAGGTSWVRVESLRGDERSRTLGALFSAWGIPTAASLAMLDGLGLELIASGGMRNGLEVAKAIALGAASRRRRFPHLLPAASTLRRLVESSSPACRRDVAHRRARSRAGGAGILSERLRAGSGRGRAASRRRREAAEEGTPVRHRHR